MKKTLAIIAPSGTGKSSIIAHLIKHFPDKFALSVSAATRNPRGTEVHGVDYYFIALEQFKQDIEDNKFVEWEMVYEGKYYGTYHSEIKRINDMEKVALLDIDVKGAKKVESQYGDEAITIVIDPPSLDELRKRLETRATDKAADIADRLQKAPAEIEEMRMFKHHVVNDDLNVACAAVIHILEQEGVLEMRA